jgi:hypothetical protein
MEDGLEFGVVLLRVGANEVDDFAVAVGRLFLIASGLVDHSEAIPAVMHIGEARDEVAGGLLGLIELAGLDEVDGGVGRRGQLVLGLVDAGVGGGEAFGDFGVRWAFAPGRRDGRERTRGFLVLGEAAALVFLAAATVAGIIASGFGHGGLSEGRHSLYRALLADARFHNLLLALDRDLAAAARAQGCARCGGVLHSAQFRRKPRGFPDDGVDEGYDRRLSFCCAVELCRKRSTPASFRFLGRKVFLGVVVVLVSALRHGTAAAVKELCDLMDVSRRTVGRWREWWRTTFVASPFWRVAAAAFMPPVDQARLPASLLERFSGEAAGQLISLLRLLLPITGGATMQAA